jgi:hypothetical protein
MVDTSITITDSGYRQVPTTGSETTKANSGSAVTLKSVKLSLDMSTLINDEPTKQFVSDVDTNAFTFGEVDKNGLNMPVWKVGGVLDMSLAADQVVLANLIECVQTKGFKQLGTTDTATNTVFLRWTDTTAVTSVNVRVKSFNCKQDAESNVVKYTLNLVETK